MNVGGQQTRGRPRGVRAGDTRERILRVARDVFSELGYEATTFQTVATRAELTRPAINHYFASKPALYRAVLAETGHIVTTAVDRARAETGLLARLAAFTLAVARPTEEDRSAAVFVVAAMLDVQRSPELAALVGDLQDDTREFLAWAFTDAVERGELVTDTDVPALIEMLSAVLWGLGFYNAFVGSPDQSAMVVDHIGRLLAGRLWQIA